MIKASKDVKYDSAIASKWLASKLDGHALYRNVINKVADALDAGKNVEFFLEEASKDWAVLWASVEGEKLRLTKKRMRLKDINGVLNGDFYSPIRV